MNPQFNKSKILVLASPNQSRLAHFQKLYQLRSEFEFAGVCIGKSLGWENRYLETWLEVPRELDNLDKISSFIISKIGSVDAIINISEAYVPLHAALCKHYGLLGPTDEMVEIGRNKYTMRQFMEKLELPIPKYCILTSDNFSALANLTFPVVVKPVIGCSSTLVQRVNSLTELTLNFSGWTREANNFYKNELLGKNILAINGEIPFIVEELLGGEVLYPSKFPYEVGEISVESIYDGKNCYVLAIHDSPIATNGPYYEKIMNSTPTRIPPLLAELAKKYVTRIHEALGPGAYVLHTEMRTFESHLKILEFGIRIGGSSLYRSVLHSTSNDFITLLIDLALKKPVKISTSAVPTIIHYFCAPANGVIQSFIGESKMQSFPHYLEHQFYDDIGDIVARPPLNTRACGYVMVRGQSFDILESEIIEMLKCLTIVLKPEVS